MTEEEKELINKLWQLWEHLAEAGEIHIGSNFSKNYDKLKTEVDKINEIPIRKKAE